jgi:hypothetical protein
MSASEYKRKLAEAKEDIAIHNDHIQDHWDAVTGLAAKKATPKTEEVTPIFPCKLPDIYDKPPF